MIDLKALKNDKERIAFLEDYRNMDNGWRLWKNLDDIQRRWWRFDMQDADVAFIVEERLQTVMYPKMHETWLVVNWFIVRDWSIPFSDNQASRTMALAELKKVTRE